MKSTFTIWLRCTCILGFVLGGSFGLQAQEPVSKDAAEFAGHLLRGPSYLFNAQQLAGLDEINRQLRQAKGEAKKVVDEASRRRAEAAKVEATQKLADLLESQEQSVRISLADEITKIPPTKPHQLPGDIGAVLFRVQSGSGPVNFVAYDVDQSLYSSKINVECAPSGTTWALIGLRNVPAKRTTLQFEFKRGELPTHDLLLDVTTPDSGQLRVSITSADTHQPTPAMMRLVWKTNGVDRQPSTAVDLAALFDKQGQAESRRHTQLPGSLGNYFWCVAKPFSMTLPPGTYDITISRGAEHIPLTDSFTVKPGERIEKSYEPRRWVDMRKLGWYSGDDHVHAQILSDEDAARLMAWIQAEDVHIANIVKMGDIYRTWFEQRGFGREYRVIDGDYVLSPGQECPRTHDEIGHTLSMNIKSMVRDTDKYFLYDWVADNVHAQGGLWGYAHINSGLFHVHRDMSMNIAKGNCDFAEVLQFQNLGTDLYYDFLNTGFKVTASAGSDVPWGGSVGEVRVYAYTGPHGFSPDAWFEAVRRGHTFVTSGPMIEFHIDDAIPGDEIAFDKPRKLGIRARAWGHPERMVPRRLEIVRHGVVIRSVESTDPSKAELSLDFEETEDNGSWIAARATATDGTTAHTTPVYLVRKGLRFWKYDAVEELIAKRLKSLDEIEQLVENAKDKLDKNEGTGDRRYQELAAQGPALLKRVSEARKLYEELRKTAASEVAIRNSITK